MGRKKVKKKTSTKGSAQKAKAQKTQRKTASKQGDGAQKKKEQSLLDQVSVSIASIIDAPEMFFAPSAELRDELQKTTKTFFDYGE